MRPENLNRSIGGPIINNRWYLKAIYSKAVSVKQSKEYSRTANRRMKRIKQ
jgi:hypothetical protein